VRGAERRARGAVLGVRGSRLRAPGSGRGAQGAQCEVWVAEWGYAGRRRGKVKARVGGGRGAPGMDRTL
jgi:hypothetical protein